MGAIHEYDKLKKCTCVKESQINLRECINEQVRLIPQADLRFTLFKVFQV